MEQYELPHGGEKTVTYFLAVYHHQRLSPDTTQIRDARLMPYDEALDTLAFPGARNALQEAEAWLLAHS